MDQEKFEDRIKGKFEGQTRKAPEGIWSQIDNSLNAELVSVYEAKQVIYKSVAVAAVIFIAVLLGILYMPYELSKGETTGESYNALLSDNLDINGYTQPYNSNRLRGQNLGFTKIMVVDGAGMTTATTNESTTSYAITESRFIAGRELEYPSPTVQHDLYPYFNSGASLQRNSGRKPASNKYWAGLEAGAGTFDSGLDGSSVLSNSVNTSSLASAIGSGGFVNPTTNVSQDMDQAMATTFGFDFGVQLGEKWTLESGVAYTNFENSGTASINVLDVYTIDNPDFGTGSVGSREAEVEVQEDYQYDVEVNNSVRFATIPLKAGYFVMNKKFSLRLNAGLSANYLMNGNISESSNQILSSNPADFYNDWSFDGIGGIEFGYSVFDKFNFTIEPNYRHAITPISNSSPTPSRFVIQTGLRYTLR